MKEIKYSSTLDLSLMESEDDLLKSDSNKKNCCRPKQFVFAGQSYGTFYAIFATIELDLEKSNKTQKSIKNIDLEILNYKGLINIGLKRAYFKEKSIGNSDIIEIELQGLSTQRSVYVEDINKMSPVTKDDWMIFMGSLKKMNKNDAVFDEEFHYRNGEFTFPNIPRYDQNERDFYRRSIKDEKAISEVCIINNSKVVF